MSAHRTLLSTLAVGTAALTAVGAGVAGATSGSEPGPAPSSTPGDDGFTIVGALEELPADLVDETGIVAMADLDAVTAANGIDRPDAGDPDAYRHWLGTMTGISLGPPEDDPPEWAPVAVYPPEAMIGHWGASDEIEAAVGFTLADAAWFATVERPPRGFTVYAGGFDETTLSPDLVEIGDGIVSLGEGDDFEVTVDGPTPLSRIGVPRRLAQRDGAIAISPDTTLVEQWLQGNTTERHDESLVAVATALDEAGAVSAVLATLGDLETALGPNFTPELRAQILDNVDLLDDSFEDEVGVGWHAVDGESVISIVYLLDDDADPDAVVSRIRAVFESESIRTRQPLSDLLVLDDVSVDGRIVTATVQPGPERSPWTVVQMLFRDSPFITTDASSDGASDSDATADDTTADD